MNESQKSSRSKRDREAEDDESPLIDRSRGNDETIGGPRRVIGGMSGEVRRRGGGEGY